MAAIRSRRQEAGFVETTVFVHERAREGIDRAIAEGRFKSRREAMEAVIHAAFVTEEGVGTRAAPNRTLRSRRW